MGWHHHKLRIKRPIGTRLARIPDRDLIGWNDNNLNSYISYKPTNIIGYPWEKSASFPPEHWKVRRRIGMLIAGHNRPSFGGTE